MLTIAQTRVPRVLGVAGFALSIAVAGPLTAYAASADQVTMQQTPPAGGGQTQTLVGVSPGPSLPQEGPPAGGLPPVPDRLSGPVGPFTMFMEVLASAEPSQAGLVASPGCVTDSVYKRGMKLVFRYEVYDMDNKTRVTSADGSTTEVHLPDGTVLPAMFIPRAAPGTDISNSSWTWASVWQIPTDYPLGPVQYSVNVSTADGRQASIDPPSLVGQPVQAGAPLVLGGTFPTIIP